MRTILLLLLAAVSWGADAAAPVATKPATRAAHAVAAPALTQIPILVWIWAPMPAIPPATQPGPYAWQLWTTDRYAVVLADGAPPYHIEYVPQPGAPQASP